MVNRMTAGELPGTLWNIGEFIRIHTVFYGDNDNHMALCNEANKTFSVAADQSAVASQPYTRYEASDTASGTKYYIDVHNDINLQIL